MSFNFHDEANSPVRLAVQSCPPVSITEQYFGIVGIEEQEISRLLTITPDKRPY